MDNTSEWPHRVGRDAGRLVPEGGGREVVQQVGQGRGQGAVILRGHDQEPITFLRCQHGDRAWELSLQTWIILCVSCIH